jgi:pimeloyl-ACP methyl ester carboxylesterase
MAAHTEQYFRSRDGLRLHYRDYDGSGERAPVLCLHGLTRNARDFDALARRIAPARRVISPDQRGRGLSQFDPNFMNYHPATYVEDMWTLLRQLGISRFVLIGTSLGGLMGMLMAAMRPQAFAGLVLNDIGPELDPVGATRIASYVGRFPPVKSWAEAVQQVRATFGHALPDYDDARWREFAALSFFEGEDGVPRAASDPKIGDALRAIPAPPGATQGMWLAFASLRSIPMLALRGATSDLLSPQTFERMQREAPQLECVTVANRGHPPQLDEPECRAAVDRFLVRVE